MDLGHYYFWNYFIFNILSFKIHSLTITLYLNITTPSVSPLKTLRPLTARSYPSYWILIYFVTLSKSHGETMLLLFYQGFHVFVLLFSSLTQLQWMNPNITCKTLLEKMARPYKTEYLSMDYLQPQLIVNLYHCQ